MIDLAYLSHSMSSALGMNTGEDAPEPIALSSRTVAKGDIHQTLRCSLAGRDWFVKWGPVHRRPMLDAEVSALRSLRSSNTIPVPKPLCCDDDGRHAWLVLPFIELVSTGDAAALGRGLANLHQCTADQYGWPFQNYIGTSTQFNGWSDHWRSFWWQRRMAPQFELARRNGHGTELDHLENPLRLRSDQLLNHDPVPSLLHGDLWGGNHGYRTDGAPLVFDPASYYGDRETDLAMMQLFGGFHHDVFKSYEATWPLPVNHEQRRPLYQLYHLMNHLNLFGSGWLDRVCETALELLDQ